MDGMSVKQSIEIDWHDVQELNKFLTQVLDRDIPEEPQWQS